MQNVVSIYPEPKLKAKILNEAEKQGRNMNNLILFIINDYFKNKSRNEKIINN